MKDKKLIPPGTYCYIPLEVIGKSLAILRCPYWSLDPNKPSQCNGCCSFLNRCDDDDEGFGLLWDQVKECGINDDID